jgi:hypothetical protein
MVTKKTFLALMVIGLVGGFIATSQADDQFTDRSIQGKWVFSADGTFLPGDVFPVPTPAAAVGLTTYDGKGGCFVSATLNVGGNVIPLSSSSCNYFVNPDGTGQQITTLPFDGAPVDFVSDLVIVAKQKELLFTISSPQNPLVASGVGKKQKGPWRR